MGARSKFFDPRSVKTAPRTDQPDLWQKLLPWAYFLLMIGFGVLCFVIFEPVIKRSQNELNRKTLLEKKIEDQKQLSIKIQEELFALQDDPYYIERMARDILNYGYEGEVIFKFPPYEPNTAGSPDSTNKP